MPSRLVIARFKYISDYPHGSVCGIYAIDNGAHTPEHIYIDEEHIIVPEIVLNDTITSYEKLGEVLAGFLSIDKTFDREILRNRHVTGVAWCLVPAFPHISKIPKLKKFCEMILGPDKNTIISELKAKILVLEPIASAPMLSFGQTTPNHLTSALPSIPLSFRQATITQVAPTNSQVEGAARTRSLDNPTLRETNKHRKLDE